MYLNYFTLVHYRRCGCYTLYVFKNTPALLVFSPFMVLFAKAQLVARLETKVLESVCSFILSSHLCELSEFNLT